MLHECLIYWIHKESETDITTQGYVGITKNLQRRIREHHGQKDFMKGREVEIFLCGERDYCKGIEKQLRPQKNIGLNIAAGGGDPPDVTGLIRSEKTRLLMSQNNIGMKGKKHTNKTKKKCLIHEKVLVNLIQRKPKRNFQKLQNKESLIQ